MSFIFIRFHPFSNFIQFLLLSYFILFFHSKPSVSFKTFEHFPNISPIVYHDSHINSQVSLSSLEVIQNVIKCLSTFCIINIPLEFQDFIKHSSKVYEKLILGSYVNIMVL
jgi:hypothetical protein